MTAQSQAELEDFCRRWLASWTGNRPAALLGFYTEDAYYQDPARPQGLQGQPAMRPYFERLLAANPDWVWELVELFPTAAGFTLKWQARVPRASGTAQLQGLDIVELDGTGAALRIKRNEVYFDPAPMRAP